VWRGLAPPQPPLGSRVEANSQVHLKHALDGHAHGAPRCDDHDLGAQASRPRRGSAGTVTAPSLTLPRWGREPGASPQRGEAGRGAEPCERCAPQPSMRLAPRTDGMKKGRSWEGAALPDPPVGRGPGARASGPHPQGDNRVLLGGLCPPRPSRGQGRGETRFPHTPLQEPIFTLGAITGAIVRILLPAKSILSDMVSRCDHSYAAARARDAHLRIARPSL